MDSITTISILIPIIVLFVIGCFIKSKTILKICVTIICIIGFLVIFAITIFAMPSWFGSNGAWLPFVFCGGLFVACLLLIWRPFTKKLRRNVVCVLVACAVVPLICVAGNQAYQNSIIEIGEGENELALYYYQPFINDTRAKSLDEESTLKFAGDLPRLDGATALYPLYSAFARATYPEAEYYVYNVPVGLQADYQNSETELSDVICSRTGEAFEHLMGGYVDVIFIMGVSDSQRADAEARGLTLKLTPIGKEAFVFFVNQKNLATNISTEEIKGIYSGQITNWSEINGRNDEIRAYQRPEDSGSQTMLQEIMGEVPLVAAPEEDVFSTMMGMYRVVSDYKNYKNSIGYSFRYYIQDMLSGNDVKLLSVDGVAPDEATIFSGEYPYSNDFYAVTVDREAQTEEDAKRMENTELLIEWILSAQGQSLVEATGYIPYS